MMEKEPLARVHLRLITQDSLQECLSLAVADDQQGLIAANAESLAEAYVNGTLVPLAIYDASIRGSDPAPGSMVGFTMYEVSHGVGFILRLMIDEAHQRMGYGRATMLEVIRRLRLHPQVEMIATSHRRENIAAANLYRSLGFVHWHEDWLNVEGEVFLQLPE